jgi:molecular chaperone HtpG
MVHSIYSDKDIFLRELVSNASDALDKLRLAVLVDKDLEVDTTDPHIAIETDRQRRTLTVRDNGIGMSGDEVVSLLGTIARSGTAELLDNWRAAQDAAASPDLIGQFGVGFYATFMVADTVTLVTRRAGDDQGTRWTSDGQGTYTVEPVDGVPHGTSVTLHLKPENPDEQLHDYTAPWKIKEIVKRYSDFISWPIRMPVAGDGEAEPAVQTLNSMKALWARPRDEVDENEYKDFYRHISHDWAEPLDTIHLKAEGSFEYEALLFVPPHAPADLYVRDAKRGVQLYVKRVFIMDDCQALVPSYLRFIKGVVDAQDLSLNISREILQRDRQIQMIRRRLIRKVLSAVGTLMTADPVRYRTFWREFGAVVKEGLLEDGDNRDAILEIASFASTADPDQPVTLRQYVDRMGEGQKEIYFATGESRLVLEKTPHLEAFRAKGYEVLLLTDPVDEVWADSVSEFAGRPLRSIAKGEVDLDAEADAEAGRPEREQQEKQFAPMLSWMAELLRDEVKDVRLSARLTTSPACLVSESRDATPTLEKIYRAMGQELTGAKRILELNPAHPLVTGLREAHERDAEKSALAETAELLHGMALLVEGGELGDPLRFTQIVAERLIRTL